MNGFITSPGLAKLVALQMIDEQIESNKRTRPRKARTPLRTRLLVRRTATRSPSPAGARRVSPTAKLAGNSR